MLRNSNWKSMISVLVLSAFTTTVFAVEDNREGISVFEETKKVKKKKRKKKSKHEFGAYAESGLGYDSNPFLTPSQSYLDQSIAAPVILYPKVNGGMFVPLFLRADYEYRWTRKVRLLADVKASGKYFTDSALSDANEYKTQLRAGIRFRFNKYKRETNRIDLRMFIGNVYEIYVDHDDAQPKISGSGLDISNRYKYKKVGTELAYKYDFKKWDFLLRGRYEYRDYETPEAWLVSGIYAPLDHGYSRVKLESGHQFTKAFHLGAYYEFRMRNYTDRKSYQIDPDGVGISFKGPNGVTYIYNDLKLFGEYKFTDAYTMKLKYLLTARQDDNQGYSDYLYHRISWINRYKFTKKISTALKLNYYVYDYENAYAFNKSTSLEKLEAEGYRAYLNTKYKFARHWSANLDLHYRDEKSTDKRYEYEEMIAMGTVKYRF